MNNISTVVSLVGDQPQPPYLVQQYFKGERVSAGFRLIATKETSDPAERIGKVLKGKNLEGEIWSDCEPYNVEAINDYLNERRSGLNDKGVIWDLTGGTKTMVMVAQTLAMKNKDRIAYLKSAGGESRIQVLTAINGTLKQENDCEVPHYLTIDDYFTLQGIDPDPGKRTSKQDDGGKRYEDAIEEALKNDNKLKYERGVHKGNLDIDFVILKGNRIAIIEAKSGKNEPKKAIGQLMSASHPKSYGTYVTKVLISANDLDENNKQLVKACKIKSICCPFDNNQFDSKHLLKKLNEFLP